MAITDLTGTKWLLNETILYDSNFPTYNITYNAYCESGAVVPLSGLFMQHVVKTSPKPSVDLYCIRYTSTLGSVDFSNFFLMKILYTGDGTTSMTNSANNPSFNTELFNRTIEITGGTDVTNAQLISWLEANGTLTPPIENKKGMFVGGNKVSKVMVGDKTVSKILIGDKVIYEVEPQSETWVINESPVFTQTFTYQVNFESNSKQYSAFACVQLARPDVLLYGDDLVYASSWTDEAHRTVTFETEPTGDLLTWLQANAVKQ